MSGLDHPHVLTLIGVCVDGGPSLYIVMPFMANGSLLSYLKADRKNLFMLEDAQDETVHFSLTPPLILKSMIVYICLKVAHTYPFTVSIPLTVGAPYRQ